MQYNILLEAKKLQVYIGIDLGLEKKKKDRVVNTRREDRTIES